MKAVLDVIDKALALGWCPIFTPFLFPRIDDHVPEERAVALDADFAILRVCAALIVVGDLVSSGMAAEIREWRGEGLGWPGHGEPFSSSTLEEAF